jgi:transcriptional regulator with XRE-family HTH domain
MAKGKGVSDIEAESLSVYVRRVMKEKGLTTYSVYERSGKSISQSYVSQIMNDAAGSITLDKLKGLADGLGVPRLELAAVAMGVSPYKLPDRRETQVRALFYGIEDLDEETKKEIEYTLRLMEKAVEQAKRTGK